jgi:hypothetical protein
MDIQSHRVCRASKNDLNNSVDRSMKDEAVIMASPEINPNLMILKGCRGTDLSYRGGGVNTTEVNFEISAEKEPEDELNREESGSRSKVLHKASLEFEKFSNNSPDEQHQQLSIFSVCYFLALC